MQSLDAALAFAITMLILAMVVTTIVETLHRVAGLREKGLAILLGNFYERVLVARGVGLGGNSEERQAFIEMMTINRGPVGAAPRSLKVLTRLFHLGARPMPLTDAARSLPLNALSEDRKFLNWIWSGRRLGSLSATTFMERLGSSPYGARLVMEVNDAGENGLQFLLKDLVQKFDAFGSEASEYFQSRARLVSVLVGFVLAGALNVNAITLFDTFMKRPDVTQAVIANSKQVTDAYRELQTKVDAFEQTAGAAQGAGTEAATRQQIEEARASVKQAVEQAGSAAKSLQSVGVPIGWSVESRTVAFHRSLVDSGMALFGLLLGGLLIGLGAPFWYQAVQTLTGIRGAARSNKETAAGTGAATPAARAANEAPTTPIDAFHAAFGAVVASGNLQLPDEAVG